MPIGVHAAVNLAQWSVGEKDTPGFGTLAVDPSNVATATIHSRSVTLNLTGVRPGAYALVVTLQTRDGRTASSLRHLSIVAPRTR